MTIRTRLALQFLLLASLILGGAFMVVYALSAAYREEEFISRLKDRGTNTAKLLIQVDEVDEQLLARIEGDNPVRLPEEVIRIFDHHNKQIFKLGIAQGDSVPPGILDQVRLEGDQRLEIGERELVAFPFTDRYDRFVVEASGRDIYGRSKLRNEGRVMIATFLIGLVLIFLVGRFYAQRALSPVQRLINEIRAISGVSLALRVQAGNEQDELAQLARSFNELLDRLEKTFLSQKNFIANASHEMRTPLTSISGQLEVLMLKARTPEEYSTALRSVLDDMHALNRLADRLLLMAQAGSKAPVASFVPVRIDEVLWQSRAEVQRTGSAHTVDIDLGKVEDEADLLVLGNENLLRSLLTNLFENACKYSDDHKAMVSLHATATEVEVVVTDKGIGIAPQDHERVFEPFYRANNTGGAKGHGIGLSLARRIAELHGGRITLSSAEGAGSRFVAHLPKAA
ncbi:MAG: HAMP domain-containing histidine kinase [Flavobacteriales bacterium]|nr:HAMP domain-containing histidine kinase [Flavobacteriales bacterium]